MNRTIALCILVLSLVYSSSGWRTRAADANQYRTKTRIVGQKYCRGDADIFTVSLKLDVEVQNVSKRTVFLAPRMIPWIARVAASLQEARSEHFLYEVTQ